jgi:hypothetical protein
MQRIYYRHSKREQEGNGGKTDLGMGILNLHSTGFVRFCPFHKRVMDESLQDTQQCLTVCSQNTQADLTYPQKHTLISSNS